MDFSLTDDQLAIRAAVRDVCAQFPGEYWRELEASGAYPKEFVATLTSLGWLSLLIPADYGGGGLGITEAGIVLEEIHASGGNANACHAQMYTMGALLRHGSEDQKSRYLPGLAAGDLRLQAFAVTEPDAGSDSTQISTRARRTGDNYVIDGQKVFISRVEQSDLMLMLARTAPADQVSSRTEGLSLFLVDLREAGRAIEIRRIAMMFNHHTYQVFISGLEVPVGNLIGAEGQGFRQIIDGWNAERCLIASEAIGDGRFFLDRAAAYASQRQVFGRPIGANQGVQFPLAQAYAQVQAASLMRFKATTLFDVGQPCGAEANAAKLLASQASCQAANAAMLTFGGNGFATEYDIERKFRETKLLEIAPVSNNLILAFLGHKVLGLPRSY
jgi:acyl-CoA dehydrogenase